MNRATACRLVLVAALLVAPLAPVLVVDTAPRERGYADDSRAVEQLEGLFRDDPSPTAVDREVLVTVRLRGEKALSADRLDVRRRYVRQGTHHVEGYVPLSAVRDLSSDPAVGTVRVRAEHDGVGRVAAGVGRIGADRLHERGLTGDGVTVGIVGGGFRVSDPELAGHVAAYRSFGPAGDADHGTAVASVVADTAPDADIHAAAVGDGTSAAEYRRAVTWLRDSGADVIVDAGSYFGHGDAGTDGLAAVARNASDETLFVTSAGNYAQRHWRGADGPDDRRWVDFEPGVEGNALAGGETFAGRVRASLQWSPAPGNATGNAGEGRNATAGDAPNATAGEYELHLFRRGAGGQRLVTSVAPAGNGSTVYLDATVPRGRYYLAVEADNVSTQHRLELFATRDLRHRTGNGSLAVPASQPGVLAVGAYDHEAESVAPFSSRGPVGNRTGVDVVAPDSVVAPGTGATEGTSFAAPYVAGTAALLADGHPNATAAELRAVLTASARDVAATGPDAAAGAGLLDARAAAAAADTRFADRGDTADGDTHGASNETAAGTHTGTSESAPENGTTTTATPAESTRSLAAVRR
jgi:hypothetical protein